MLRAILNFVGFQSVWFLSLFGAGTQRSWLGVGALVLFTAWHLRSAGSLRGELVIVLVAILVGFTVDTTFIQAGLLSYSEPMPFAAVAPYWILGLWVNFALTLNGSMRWLHGRYALAAILGAVGGPMSYAAGIGMGAAELLASGVVVYGTLAVVWAVAVPVLVLATEAVNRRWPPRLAESPAG
ncbi:MAG: DUF2878 domain-containing protein [Gammaproteobacteria bacterium]|nr:DUF2878 domain-containing protein [Gammaproteobacteria bacterium]